MQLKCDMMTIIGWGGPKEKELCLWFSLSRCSTKKGAGHVVRRQGFCLMRQTMPFTYRKFLCCQCLNGQEEKPWTDAALQIASSHRLSVFW
jgi:hypothetical protein